MKTINIKNKNIGIVLALIFTFIGLLSLEINTRLVGQVIPYNTSALKIYILPILVTIIILYFTKLLNKAFENRFNINNLISTGWYVVLASLILGIVSYIGLKRERTPGLDNYIIFIISCFLTATFEELLFRGIVQNIVIEGFKNSGKSLWSAILCSSFIFGIVHLGNLYVHPELIIGTISQVFYAFILGVFFGVVYYINKNIISTILLHAIFNVFGLFSLIYIVPKSGRADLTLFAAILPIIIVAPGFFLARRNYKRKIENK